MQPESDSMLTLEEFSKWFWNLKEWVQNGTYPEWPYAVYEFIMEKRLKRIIEVGVGTGPVSVAITLTKPEILVGIDDERERNCLKDAARLCSKAGLQVGVWHQATSAEILPSLQGPFDLLVHDGEHSFRSVENDCREARRLGVRYIIIHDSDWPEVRDAIFYLHMPNWALLESSGFPRVIEVPCKA